MMVEPPYSMWTVQEIEAVHNECINRGTRLRRVEKWYGERLSELRQGDDVLSDFIILKAETLDELAGILLKPTQLKGERSPIRIQGEVKKE